MLCRAATFVSLIPRPKQP